MKKINTTIHTSVIARQLRKQVGVPYMTTMFNTFKARYGKTENERKPVKNPTVLRYTNRGEGYEPAPPFMFRRFCLSRVSKKF